VDAALLETTLATEFVPGTNVKGRVAGANWSFLLPSLEARLVVALGEPAPAALRTLARLAARVVVLCASPRELRRVERVAGAEGLANVAAVVCGRGMEDFPFRREQFDLIAVVGPWRRETSDSDEERSLHGLIRGAFRYLRKGGALVLGFPNRFGLPAPHVPAPGGARGRGLIKGTVASSRSRLVRGGFHDPQFYLPFPDFTDYSALVSLDSRIALRYFHGTYRHPRARWKRVLMGAAIESGLLPLVAPSYIATAKKP